MAYICEICREIIPGEHRPGCEIQQRYERERAAFNAQTKTLKAEETAFQALQQAFEACQYEHPEDYLRRAMEFIKEEIANDVRLAPKRRMRAEGIN